VGSLQLDIAIARLSDEYKVKALYESLNAVLVRWVSCSNTAQLRSFCTKYEGFLALDWSNNLAYIAPTAINLGIVQERNPNINFHKIREY
jgi:peptide chain release factor 3